LLLSNQPAYNFRTITASLAQILEKSSRIPYKSAKKIVLSQNYHLL